MGADVAAAAVQALSAAVATAWSFSARLPVIAMTIDAGRQRTKIRLRMSSTDASAAGCCSSKANSIGLSSPMSIMDSRASIFCSIGSSYVMQSMSPSSWYGSSPLGCLRKVDSFLNVVESNFDSTYQYFVLESVTFRRLKFASARINHASGSALSNIESCTEAPKTAAASNRERTGRAARRCCTLPWCHGCDWGRAGEAGGVAAGLGER